MKTRHILLPIFIGITLFTVSCRKGRYCEPGNGTIVEVERPVNAFLGVVVDIPAEVHLVQGPVSKVVIKTDDNLIEKVRTEVKSGILHIDQVFGSCIGQATTLHITVQSPEFHSVEVSGTATVLGMYLSGLTLDTEVSGSGHVRLDSLNYQQIYTNISGSGDVRLSSAPLTLMRNNISGSGSVFAYSVPANHVITDISGSGDAVVYPLQRLDAVVSGSGTVRYRGNPTVINTEITGNGSVKPY